jgi:hypothetical protein
MCGMLDVLQVQACYCALCSLYKCTVLPGEAVSVLCWGGGCTGCCAEQQAGAQHTISSTVCDQYHITSHHTAYAALQCAARVNHSMHSQQHNEHHIVMSKYRCGTSTCKLNSVLGERRLMPAQVPRPRRSRRLHLLPAQLIARLCIPFLSAHSNEPPNDLQLVAVASVVPCRALPALSRPVPKPPRLLHTGRTLEGSGFEQRRTSKTYTRNARTNSRVIPRRCH